MTTHRETPGQMAVKRIGDWPEGISGKRNGLAAQHAAGVWRDAVTGMVDRAGTLWTATDQDRRTFDGAIDLAFLATVGAHLQRCDRCWKTWIDGEVPVDLLTRGIRRTPAWEVFRPILREARLQMGRGHH